MTLLLSIWYKIFKIIRLCAWKKMYWKEYIAIWFPIHLTAGTLWNNIRTCYWNEQYFQSKQIKLQTYAFKVSRGLGVFWQQIQKHLWALYTKWILWLTFLQGSRVFSKQIKHTNEKYLNRPLFADALCHHPIYIDAVLDLLLILQSTPLSLHHWEW